MAISGEIFAEEGEVMKEIFAFIGGLIAFYFLAALRGFVISRLWEWFAVPLGVVPIGICWAIGLGIIVGMYTPSHRIRKRKNETNSEFYGRMLAKGLVATLVPWGMGWFIHWLMIR